MIQNNNYDRQGMKSSPIEPDTFLHVHVAQGGIGIHLSGVVNPRHTPPCNWMKLTVLKKSTYTTSLSYFPRGTKVTTFKKHT